MSLKKPRSWAGTARSIGGPSMSTRTGNLAYIKRADYTVGDRQRDENEKIPEVQ